MPIFISSLSIMPNLVKDFNIQDLVSIVGPEFQPPTPCEILPSRHHRCAVDDIIEAQPEMTVPQRKHIKDVVKFLDSWDKNTGLLIHCHAGVSRSTAVALIAHTQKTRDPQKSAIALREAAPYARPNSRIVSLADSIMGFNGDLERAREDMGPAIWESDPDYIAPQLQGNDTRGYEAGRYAILNL